MVARYCRPFRRHHRGGIAVICIVTNRTKQHCRAVVVGVVVVVAGGGGAAIRAVARGFPATCQSRKVRDVDFAPPPKRLPCPVFLRRLLCGSYPQSSVFNRRPKPQTLRSFEFRMEVVSRNQDSCRSSCANERLPEPVVGKIHTSMFSV